MSPAQVQVPPTQPSDPHKLPLPPHTRQPSSAAPHPAPLPAHVIPHSPQPPSHSAHLLPQAPPPLLQAHSHMPPTPPPFASPRSSARQHWPSTSNPHKLPSPLPSPPSLAPLPVCVARDLPPPATAPCRAAVPQLLSSAHPPVPARLHAVLPSDPPPLAAPPILAACTRNPLSTCPCRSANSRSAPPASCHPATSCRARPRQAEPSPEATPPPPRTHRTLLRILGATWRGPCASASGVRVAILDVQPLGLPSSLQTRRALPLKPRRQLVHRSAVRSQQGTK